MGSRAFRYFRVIKLMWILVCVAILVVSLVVAEDFFLGIAMTLLCMPAAMVVGLIALALIHLPDGWGMVEIPIRLRIVLEWALVFIAGYTQWFVLLPRLIKCLRDPNAGLKS